MKKAKFRTPDHMLFESGHKTFDRQVASISSGNVLGNEQFSSYIRPSYKIECNGFDFPEKHLQDRDLRQFARLPKGIASRTRKLADAHGSVILYEFRHFVGSWHPRKIVHGYVITAGADSYRLLKKFVTGPTYKSAWVIDEAIKYIAEKTETCPLCHMKVSIDWDSLPLAYPVHGVLDQCEMSRRLLQGL